MSIRNNPSVLSFGIGAGTLGRTETLAAYFRTTPLVIGHYALRRLAELTKDDADPFKSFDHIDKIRATHRDLHTGAGYYYQPSDRMRDIFIRYQNLRQHYQLVIPVRPPNDTEPVDEYQERLPLAESYPFDLRISAKTSKNLADVALHHTHGSVTELGYAGLLVALENIEQRLTDGELGGPIKDSLTH